MNIIILGVRIIEDALYCSLLRQMEWMPGIGQKRVKSKTCTNMEWMESAAQTRCWMKDKDVVIDLSIIDLCKPVLEWLGKLIRHGEWTNIE